MGSTGMIVMFVCTALLIVVGLTALGDFHSEAKNNTSASIQANADLGISVANPLFTVLSYICLIVVAIAVLSVFRNF